MLPQQLPALQQQAFDALFTELQDKLRQRASILCRNERSPSFNTNDLLNDLYLRLKRNPTYALAIAEQGYPQFLAMAAKAMRNILTDAARKLKHSLTFVTLSHIDEQKPGSYSREDLISVDEALRALAQSHPRRAAIIELRFYAGLSIRQLQQHFGVCDATIENDIRIALKILHGILQPEK